MKEKLKVLWNFETLITEKIIRYVYIALICLMAFSSLIWVLFSWFLAFQVIRYSFLRFLTLFIGAPIGAIIFLAVYVVLLRLGVEALLVRFRIYHETKEINEKLGETKPPVLALEQENVESET